MLDSTTSPLGTPLQLINKESFITQLEAMNGVPLFTDRAISGCSSDYNASNGRDSGPVDRRSLLSAQVTNGFFTVEELFYNAQKDYVEQFVLGIDPRDNEQIRGLDRIIMRSDASSNGENLLLSQKDEKDPKIKVARFEGLMERFSSLCFVLDPSVRAQGDS